MVDECFLVSMNNIAEIIMGQSPPGETYNEYNDGIPFYQGVTDFGLRYPKRRVYCNAPTRIGERGDILFSVRAPIGRVNLATEKCAIGRGLAVIRAIDPIDQTYLEFVLRSKQDEWYALESQGSIFGNAKKSDLVELPIFWHSKKQRLAIARILSSLDDKIELNQQMIRTLEAQARTIFKSWFVDFDPVRAKMEGRLPAGMDAATAALFPDAFEESELGMIPKGWRVGTLKDCCQRVENGGTPKRSEPEYWQPGIIPWLTSGEVRQKIVTSVENFISTEGLRKSSAKLWAKGTTVVALYGATAGQVCLLATEMCANQACCGLIPTKNMQFFIFLKAASSVAIFEQQARGSAQQNLSQQIVADFLTIIPNSALLEIFDRFMQPTFEKWITNLQESRNLDTLRDFLLPKLMSGEIRVKEAEKMVGDVA